MDLWSLQKMKPNPGSLKYMIFLGTGLFYFRDKLGF